MPTGSFTGLMVLAVLSVVTSIAEAKTELGIDVLQKMNFAPLVGRRIGLVTNQTGVNGVGVRTRVVLRRSPVVNLVALFTPEHGLDGTEKAGKYVATRRDPVTGLLAHSLYGSTRKPTPKMLAGIDTLVYDMQDIGARSYTYISTMILCMKACGELGIEFVVLDRPNPLGGLRVQGPPIDPRWISFVGQIPVPYVHGMTACEIARMAVGMGWAPCKLRVIDMRGWRRSMEWPDTGLRWVQTSPNIPRETSPGYYVVTGLIGSLSGVDIGVGGPTPFEFVTAPFLDGAKFTRDLRRLPMPGIRFDPLPDGAKIEIGPHAKADLCVLALWILARVNSASRPSMFARSKKDTRDIFFKVYGTDSIRSDLTRKKRLESIVAKWERPLREFRKAREPYLLYR